MPIYPYRCPTCGRSQDAFNKIDARDASAPVCCGTATVRQLSAPMVTIPGEIRYRCPVTDQIVTSERQRKNLMAEHRLVDANDFTPEYIVKRKKAKTAENQRLAAQLLADVPKEIASQAQEIVAAA